MRLVNNKIHLELNCTKDFVMYGNNVYNDNDNNNNEATFNSKL